MKPLSSYRRSIAVVMILLMSLWHIEQPLHGATFVWNQTATGTYSWITTSNWTPSGFPNSIGDVASLNNAITGNVTVNLDQVITLGTLNIGAPSGTNTFTLAAGTAGYLTMDVASGSAAINKTSGGADTISAGIQFNDGLDVTNSSGSTLTLSGALRSLASNIAFLGAGNTTISGLISTAGGLTKNGAGTLTLSGTNTYSGTTTVSGGTLAFSGGSILPARSAVSVAAGATLDYLNTATTIGSLSGAGDVKASTASGARVLTIGRADTSTIFTGRFIAPGTATRMEITKIGAGTLTLQPSGTNASTYTGNTIINGGSVVLDSSNSTLTSGFLAATPLQLTGGNFELKGRAGATITQTVGNFTVGATGGVLAVTPNGGASTTLTLGNFTATVSGGTLLVSAPAVATTGKITTSTVLPSTSIYGAGRAVFFDGTNYNWLSNNGTALTFGGMGVGSAPVYTGTLSPTGGGAVTDNLTLTGGQVQSTAATTVGTLKITTSGPAQVLDLGGLNLTLGNATGPVTGSLLVTGADDYSISNGSLLAAGAASDLIIHQYGTNAAGLTLNAGIGENAVTNLVKAGSGLLTLAGSNTYTGTTFVNGGTLSFSNAGTTGTGTLGLGIAKAVTIRDGATLQYTGNTATLAAATTANSHTLFLQGGNATIEVTTSGQTLQVDGVISGGGGLTKTGGGALGLNGANTYTGPTIITAGTLTIVGADKITDSSPLTISGGATFNMSAGNETVGSISGAGTIQGGGTARTLAAGGDNTSTTFSGSFTGAAANVFSKSGSGTLTIQLAGLTAWTGNSAVNSGTLMLNNSNGLPSTGIWTTGNSAQPALLDFNGFNATVAGLSFYGTSSALSSQGTVDLGGATVTITGNSTVSNNNNPQAAVITGGGGLLMTAARTLDVRDSTTVAGTAAELLIEVDFTGAAGGITKNGGGNLRLTGTSSFTGATANTFNSGITWLDYTVNNTAKIGTGGALAFGGGTLILTGNNTAATTQTVTGLTLTTGSGVLTLNAGTGQTLALNIGSTITRSASGGLLRINLPSGSQSASHGVITTAANTNGILGGFLTVYDGTTTGFATNSGGNVVALASTTQDAVASWTTGQNITDSSGFTGSTTDFETSINSLRFNAGGPSTVTVLAGGLLRIASGGVLQTSNVTGNTSTITGGRLDSGTSSELMFTVDSATQRLEVSSALLGGTVITKAGNGVLRLSGVNSYTGTTNLFSGTLQVSGGNAIGDTSTLTIFANQSSIFEVLASETIGTLATGGQNQSSLATEIKITSGSLTINQGSGTTYSGAISGTGTLIKSGTGTLAFAAAPTSLVSGNQFTGTVIINQGILEFSGSAGGIAGAASWIINGSGALYSNKDNGTEADALGNSVGITLNNTNQGGSTFNMEGLVHRTNQGNTKTETIGSISLAAGHNTITSYGNATNGIAQLVISTSTGITRSNRATVLVRGNSLGATSGQRGAIRVSDATANTALNNAEVGGGGVAGSTNIGIIPWMVGDLSQIGLGNSFVTNVGTAATEGLRPLVTTSGTGAEYIFNQAGYNGLTGVTTQNVRFDTNPSGALTGAATAINALALDSANALAITGPSASLEITAGAILAAQAAAHVIGGFTGITTGGSRDFVFYVTSAGGSLQFDSPLTSIVPLVKSGAGTLILGSASNAFTDIYFNQGTVQADAINKLGSGVFNFFGGGLKFGAAFDASTRTMNFGTGGAIIDTSTFDVVFANAIGNSGAGGLIKNGGGTLTLQAANTFTGATTVNAGRLILDVGNNRLPSAAGLTLTSTGVLQLGTATAVSNQTVTSLVGAATNSIAGGNASVSTLTANLSGETSYLGFIGGAGTNENNIAITKTGNGALTLGAVASTFTGGITIKAGSVIGGNNAATFGVGTITLGDTSGSANASVTFFNTATYANPIVVASGSTGVATIFGGITSGGPTLSGGITLNKDLILTKDGTTGTFTVSGGVTGTGNLFIINNVTSTGVITLTTAAVNHAGSITNSSLASSNTTISAQIGSNVTNVIQNSATSKLILSNGQNAFTSDVLIKAGTLQGSQNTAGQLTSLGLGSVRLGDASGSANAAFEAQGTQATYANPIILGGTSGTLTIQSANSSNAVIFTGGITGSNNVTFTTGTGSAAMTFSTGAINNAGSLTNATVTGTGSLIISANVGSSVTSVIQNSTTAAMTLSGANIAFTGGIQVQAGVLNITGGGTTAPTPNALTVAGGGTLNLVNGAGQAFNLGSGAINLGAGGGTTTLSLELGGTYDSFSTSGAATTANNVVFNLAGISGFGAGTYDLLSATSGLDSANYNIGVLNSALIGQSLSLSVSSTLVRLTAAAASDSYFWDGATGSTSWVTFSGNATNWSSDLAGDTNTIGTPGAAVSVIFSSDDITGPSLATTLDATFTIKDLAFNNQTAADTLTAVTINPGSGGTLTITPASSSAGIDVQTGAPGAITLAAPITLGANQTWNVADAAAVLSSSGGIGGTANLIKTGSGVLQLTGTNNYNGTTTVNGGVLRPGVANGFNQISAHTIGASGTLQLNGFNAAIASLAGSGTVENNSATNAVLTVGSGNTSTVFSGNLQNGGAGTLALTKTGTGVLELSGTNTYTGNTTVSAGVLTVSGTQTGNGTTSSGSSFVLGGTAGTSVLNVSGTISSYFQFSGATVAGANAVYNQTAGTASFTSTSATVSSFLSNSATGFGALNITGGTTDILGRFILSRNGAATAYVGGTGTLNLKGEWGMIVYTLSGALGSLTIGPGGTVDRTGASNRFGIFMEQANQYGVFNVAGGTYITTNQSVVFGNSGNGNNNTGFLNLAGGTFSTGANVIQSVGTSTGQNAYINLAGGTLKATATLSNAFPLTVTGQTVTVTNFGAINNLGIAQDFAGGLTVDTNGNSVTIQNPILAATGSGVAQSSLTVTPGSGYVGAPLVQFVGGTLAAGGTPAAGYAIISGGQVTEIVITSPGTYTAAPTVVLTGGGGSGASVTVGALVANTSGGLTKISAGTLTLSGASTFTGALTISAGTVASATFNSMGTSGTLGAGTGAGAIVLNGGALSFTGTTVQTTDRQFTLTTNGGVLDASGTSTNTITYSDTGAITLSGTGTRTLTFGGTNTSSNTFNGQIINDGANATTVAKIGAGTWVLNNASNNYSGGTNITAGVLILGASGVLGSTGNITFTGAGTLRWSTGLTDDLSGRIVLTDAITGTVDTNGNNLTFANAVGTTGGTAGVLNKAGAGALTLNGAATHTGGVTLTTGTLNLGHAGALSTGTFTIATAGVVIDNTTGSALTLSSNPAQAWNADFTFTGTNDLNLGTGAVTLGAARIVTTNANTLTVGGAVGGLFALTKSGAGTLYLTGTNTFGAAAGSAITLNAGTLKVDSEAGLGNVLNDVTFATTGAILQVTNGFSANAGKVFTANTGVIATIQVDAGTLTINSALVGTSTAGGFVKTGSGTLALAAPSTAYDAQGAGAGGVTGVGFRVDAGTLLLQSASNSVVGDNNPTNMTIQLNGGSLSIRTDVAGIARANLYVSAAGTLTVDNDTDGAGITQVIGGSTGQQLTMGTGASTLNIIGGSNVTSGTAVVQFNNATFLVDPTFNITNPTGATTQLKLGAVTAGATTATFTGNGNFTQSGVWTGTGGITLGVTYSGLATLSQTNTYSGVTTINGGTLAFTASNQLGDASTTNDITMGGGTLRFTAAGTTVNLNANRQVNLTSTTTSTIEVTSGSGVLQATGGITTTAAASLVKAGLGNLQVTAALNLNGGDLNVSAGTFTGGLSAAGVGNLTVASTGVLQLVDSAATSVTLAGALTIQGGARLGFELNALGTNDSITSTAVAVTTSGLITLDFYNLGGLGVGTYNLLSSTNGGLLSSGVSYALGSAPSGFNYVINQSDMLISVTASILSNIYWTNSQATGSWNTLNTGASNFSTDLAGTTNTGAVPTSVDTVIFSATTVAASPVNTTLDAAFTIDSLVFNANPAGGTFSIAAGTGGSLNLSPVSTTNGISVGNNGGAVTISAPLTAGTTQTWSVDGTGTSSLAITGNVTFTAGVTKSGAGTLTLSGANSGSGSVILGGGTLNINSATAIGGGTFTVGAGTTFNNSTAGGITLTTNNVQVWNGDFTFAGTQALNMGTGNVTLGNNVVATVSASTLTIGGNLSDGASSYNFTKSGAGTLTVGGNTNDIGGTLLVNAGILNINGGATSLGVLSVMAGTASLNSNLTVAGGVSLVGGTLTMNGTNGITGTLLINGATVTANGANTIGGGLSATAGTATMNGNNNITGAAVVIGGTLTLGGSNTISSGVTLTSGTLNINNAGALGSQPFTINGGTLNNSSGSSVTVSGNNAMEWNNSFTFTGGNALNLGTGSAILGSSVTVTASASTLTIGGAIDDGTNTFNLTKAGAGTLVLAGLSSTAANNYSGTTILDGGTTSITSSASFTGGLTFGSSSASTSLSTLNLNTGSATFAGSMTVQTNSTTTNTITIGSGQALTANGNVTIGSSTGALSNTKLTVSGAGSFVVNNGASNASFTVAGYTGSTSGQGNIATADFSGLSVLNISLNTTNGIVRINNNSSTNTTGAVGTLILANTSTLTAATLAVGDGGQYNSGTQTNALKIGSGVNTLNFNTINIGTGARDFGTLTFNGAGGSIVINNAAGSGRAALNIGTAGGSGTGTGGATNIFDVTGHDATLNLAAVNIGTQNRGNNQASTFVFDQGDLDMTSLTVSTRTANPGTGSIFTTSSTINLGGGTVVIQNGILNLGLTSGTLTAGTAVTGTINITGGIVTVGATSGTSLTMATAVTTTTATANLNLAGGTTTMSGNIVKGGGAGTTTATITLNGASAVLDMGGGGSVHSIGSVSNTIALNLQQGTLKNLSEFNGGAGLVKTGGGTVILENTGVLSNTYTGGTTISSGILQVGSGSTTGTLGSGTITNNATLTFNRSNSYTVNDNIITTTNGGKVIQAGSGTTVLGGTNTYEGGTDINAGVLQVNSANAVGITGNITFGGGSLQHTVNNTADYSARIANSTAAIKLDTNGQNVTYASVLASSNTGGLAKSGAGTLKLTAANEYSGATTVTAGTLEVDNTSGSGTGSGSVTVSGDGTKLAGSGTIAGSTIIGSGSILAPGEGNTGTGNSTLTFTASTTSVTTANDAQIQLGVTTADSTDSAFAAWYHANPGGTAAGYLVSVGGIGNTNWNNTPVSGGHDFISAAGTIVLGSTGSGDIRISVSLNGLTSVTYGSVFNMLDWSTASTKDQNSLIAMSGGGNAFSVTNLQLEAFSGALSNYTWDTSVFSSYGILVVVPEPSRALFLLLGLFGLMLRRRRR